MQGSVSGTGLPAVHGPVVDRRRLMLGMAGATAGAFLAPLYIRPAVAGGIGGEIQVMAWEGYELTNELAAWRAANGVTVTAASIAVQDDVHTKFIAGNPPPIDLAEYNQAYADLYIRQMEIVQPIDLSKMPNYNPENLFDVFYDKPTWFSNGKLWGTPYIWGFNTILYNPAAIATPASYTDLLDPAFKGRIAIMDDTVSTWPVAARVAGLGAKYPLLTAHELAATFAELVKYREQSRLIALNQGELLNFMVSGEIDAVLCADPAILTQATEQGIELAMAIPSEGPVLWVDAWFIPISADNVETATAFMNESLDPKVQAQVAMAVVQAPVSKKAVDLLDEESRARIDYDRIDDMFAAGLPGIPPIEDDGVHATYDDWINAWQAFKAGM